MLPAEIVFKEQLLMKDYISYLTYTTLVSNCTNNVVLISQGALVLCDWYRQTAWCVGDVKILGN
jgi:hypothetical protein